MNGQFHLPLFIDVAAIFLFSLTGAMAALKKHYDIIGVFALALVTGSGGILLRESLFLHSGPPVIVTNSIYLVFVIAGCVLAVAFRSPLMRYERQYAWIFLTADALGLGLYAVYGAQKALLADLDWVAALLIGLTNAVGGGLLRDLLTRDEPFLFKPGQFYAAAAIVGSAAFLGTALLTPISAGWAAAIGISVTFGIRMGSVIFNWHTVPAEKIHVRLFPFGRHEP